MYSWQIGQFITARCNVLRTSEFELISDKFENPSILSVTKRIDGEQVYDIATDDGYSWTVYVNDGNK